MKKPVGMSREVFALLKKDGPAGESLTLAPTTAADGMLKEKRARMVGWEWKEFNNSARSDGLRLSHWGKNNDKSTDYTFARFNKTVRVLSYTDDEYTKHLTHPGWEKSESDELFDLCRRFDLRWPVIHDRFAGAKPDTPRPMEQLKERYYEMCKMLLNARAEQGEAEAAGHPLVKFKFDPRQEKERKRIAREELKARQAAEAAARMQG